MSTGQASLIPHRGSRRHQVVGHNPATARLLYLGYAARTSSSRTGTTSSTTSGRRSASSAEGMTGMDVPASAARAWSARHLPRQIASADPHWPAQQRHGAGRRRVPDDTVADGVLGPRANRARRPSWPPCRATIRARRRDHGSRHRLGGTAGAEKGRAPVEAELSRGASAEASRRQHPGHRGRGVVRVVTTP